MNQSTFAGLVLSVIFIITSIMLGGDIRRYFDLPSVMIVVGGTFSATLITYSFDQIKVSLPKLRDVFFTAQIDLDKDLEILMELAQKARREGLLALDGLEFDHDFLRKGIELIVDGTDPELVKDIMEADISNQENEDQVVLKMMSSMAQYAPAFGMVGTLIGLINMLMFLSDSATLGPSMATALITTFYGVILANVLFLPFAAKMKTASEQRINRLEMVLEGILSIQNGENPRIIKEKLQSFMQQAKKKAMKPQEKAGVPDYGQTQTSGAD